MKKPLMTLGLEEITEEQAQHYWMKWLYYYGGAGDVVSLKEFRDTYDSDMYGDINIYSSDMCPCVMCLQENVDDQQITEDMV